MAESALRDYPWVGIALLVFGGLTFLAAASLCVYMIAMASVGLAVFYATVSVWVAGVWLMVLGGVRDDWPEARRVARER